LLDYLEHLALELKENHWIYLILIIYIIILTVLILNHEPWFDESNPWLMARDGDILDIFTKYLRYEGFPGLWYLILIIPAKLNLPFLCLNLISGLIATVSAFIILRYSPFPPFFKILIPFSYFLFYQYAVVSRTYVLIPFFLFLLAKHERKKNEKVFLYAFLLGLLANTSAHGFIISGALSLIFARDLLLKKVVWQKRLKQIKALVLIGFFLFIAFLQVYPIPQDKIPHRDLNFSLQSFIQQSPQIINDSLTENMYVSLLTLAVLLVWMHKKKLLLEFLLPTGSLLLFFSFGIYKPWHQGILFMVLLYVFWIGWGKNDKRKLFKKIKLESLSIAAMTLILFVHIYWAVSVSISDYYEPYSGSKEIALFIKDNKIKNKKIFATGFHSFSILPYFDSNIFDNYNSGKEYSFFLWSKKKNEMIAQSLDGISYKKPVNIAQYLGNKYDYVILGIKFHWQKEILKLPGYQFIRIFKGYIFWKDRALEQDSFSLYKLENHKILKNES